MRFYPLFASQYFTRTNLDNKQWGLLVVGRLNEARHALDELIDPLRATHSVHVAHWQGARRGLHEGALAYVTEEGEEVHYLNKFSELLGRARFVAFGESENSETVYKFYECLGSGAIPILPPGKDLYRLHVHPWIHYIPLSAVSEKLGALLGRYDELKHIAVNAVKWHKEHCDDWLFNGFEDLIQEVTEYRYPRRAM